MAASPRYIPNLNPFFDLYDHSTRRPGRRIEIRTVWAEPWGPTMQSARNAASSSASLHDQVEGPRPMRALLLNTGGVASPTNAALELHDRIEVWVNEGGAGGEANP
jgi:hypothetical protein